MKLIQKTSGIVTRVVRTGVIPQTISLQCAIVNVISLTSTVVAVAEKESEI